MCGRHAAARISKNLSISPKKYTLYKYEDFV